MKRIPVAFRYLIYGILFGFGFPIAAGTLDILYHGYQFTLTNYIHLQRSDFLYWIIDTAPFFLGLFAYFAGIRQKKIEENIQNLEQTVSDRTKELLEANIILEKEIIIREESEMEQKRLSQMLGKRVKELSCLHGISKMIEEEEILDNLLGNIVKILPSGMTEPEKVWSRLLYNEQSYTFNESKINESCKTKCNIKVFGAKSGLFEVGYSEDIIILGEEIEMIETISSKIGMFIERHQIHENNIEQEKLATAQKLARAVAHEFNQPLQVLQSSSYLLETGDQEKIKELNELITKQITRISELVENLLNITTVESEDYAGGEDIIKI